MNSRFARSRTVLEGTEIGVRRSETRVHLPEIGVQPTGTAVHCAEMRVRWSETTGAVSVGGTADGSIGRRLWCLLFGDTDHAGTPDDHAQNQGRASPEMDL